MPPPKFWIGPLFLLLCLALGTWLRWVYPPDWLLPNHGENEPAYSPYMVDADGYTRLIRAQRILNGEGLIQSFHPHENYPAGIVPSTTLPFDLLILATYPVMALWSVEPLDWAGAVSAWLCFPAILALMYFWSGRLGWRWEARVLLLIGVAVAPGMMWATPFGRPDHQALVLLLLAGALAAELVRWDPQRRDTTMWAAIGGACWGLALWTSLFEPLILFLLVLGTNLIARRRDQHPFLIALGIGVVIAVLLEGAHLRAIVASAFSSLGDETTRDALGRWSETVGELRPMLKPWSITVNLALLIWMLPLTLIRLYSKEGLKLEHHLLVALTLLLTFLTLMQSRWFYFGTLGLLLLTALWLHREKVTALRVGALAAIVASWVFSWWAMFDEMSSRLPNPINPQVKKLAQLARQPDTGSVIGPYWLSPIFTYYSGRPMVASSSHLTIEGILDTSEFFTTTSWKEANTIMHDRQAGWVLVYEPNKLIPQCLLVTGESMETEKMKGLAEFPVGVRLYLARAVPTRYKLIGVQPELRLYRYQESPAGPPTIIP